MPFYYVSPSGDDANDGLSPAAAWRTCARASAQQFRPGDTLLFEGGEEFLGSLHLWAPSFAIPAERLTVSSYGEGRATILSPDHDHGISVWNVANVTLYNLNVRPADPDANAAHGIHLYGEENFRMDNILIASCEVSGHRSTGVYAAGGYREGFTNLVVIDVDAHHNVNGGIGVYAEVAGSFRNVYVARCNTYSNRGRLPHDMGGGILLCAVDGAIIEHCKAWDNCKDADYGSAIGAGWVSRNVVIQHCEAWDNGSANQIDGGGIFLDQGYDNCVIQYCYTHDNQGPGLTLYGWDYTDYVGLKRGSRSVIRYCVSVNDGWGGNCGGLMTIGEGHFGCAMHNNTVVVPSGKPDQPPLYLMSLAGESLSVHNNLFVTGAGGMLADVTSREKIGALDLRHNAYWSGGGRTNFRVNGRTLRKWGAWLQHDPEAMLADPHFKGGVGVDAYKLSPLSPLIGAGLDLAALGIDNGSRDYWGNAVGAECSVGAHEPG